MTEEEKKAIKSMKKFARYKDSMSAVSASEINIILNLVEKQAKQIAENVELKAENKIRLIDLANCKIVYECTDNDGYYWSGIIVLKYGEKYCVVEYQGSGSGYIENQIESVDKEFLSNAITTNLYSSTYKGNFGKFLEETYGEFSFYSLEVGRIGRQLVEQNAVLLDYKDIKDYIVRGNKNGIN